MHCFESPQPLSRERARPVWASMSRSLALAPPVPAAGRTALTPSAEADSGSEEAAVSAGDGAAERDDAEDAARAAVVGGAVVVAGGVGAAAGFIGLPTGVASRPTKEVEATAAAAAGAWAYVPAAPP
jgi:hypothetical protein